jgi:hypothetical protein
MNLRLKAGPRGSSVGSRAKELGRRLWFFKAFGCFRFEIFFFRTFWALRRSEYLPSPLLVPHDIELTDNGCPKEDKRRGKSDLAYLICLKGSLIEHSSLSCGFGPW